MSDDAVKRYLARIGRKGGQSPSLARHRFTSVTARAANAARLARRATPPRAPHAATVMRLLREKRSLYGEPL